MRITEKKLRQLTDISDWLLFAQSYFKLKNNRGKNV